MDAQLAEVNSALQAPLARREFANKLFFTHAAANPQCLEF